MNYKLRAKFWDYESDGVYFVTFKTENNQPFLGKLNNEKCELSDCGEQVQKTILQLPNQFDYMHLGEFVVMPDHVHLLLCINHERSERTYPDYTLAKKESNTSKLYSRLSGILTPEEIESIGGVFGADNPMIQKSLGHVIRWLKGRTTFECRKVNKEFSWQSRYHDRIVRNEHEMRTIQKYILENPTKSK